ncbi:hypothetical protein KC957_00605 [Candidatus Saccharibacteria bacterium]|nr:hypothetical protein [Candidatus Saccharibacteria bacterium]
MTALDGSASATSEQLRLTAPGVGPEMVSQDFETAVRTQIDQARAYLAGDSDDIPYGFAQTGNAYLPPAELLRDFYIEQFSEAFGAGTYGFDEMLNGFEERNAANNAATAGEQPVGSHPNSVTVRLLPSMKQRLTMPDPEVEEAVPGAIFRGLELPGSTAERPLRLYELEVPRTTSSGTAMNRLVFFVKN